MPGSDMQERPFREACCLCGKEVAGRLVAAADAEPIAQEDLSGYRCTSCGLAYCRDCAVKHVFRTNGHSVCRACGARAHEADHVVSSRPRAG